MNPVLVDTSVWIDHFRQGNPHLVQLLQQDMTLMHPLVLGELACGTPPARARTLADLQRLKPARQASMREVMALIEREQLFGLGCGQERHVHQAAACGRWTSACTRWPSGLALPTVPQASRASRADSFDSAASA